MQFAQKALVDAILDYGGCIEQPAYIAALLEKTDIKNLNSILTEMLREPDRDQVSAAGSFV